jgi:hypothetical protein
VASIIADHAVELIPAPGLVDVLASGNRTTTRVLAGDLPVPTPLGDRPEHCPFATVRAIGDGFSCFISALVTPDWLLEHGGQNDIWLLNVIELLRASSKAEADLRRPIRAIQRAYRAAQEAALYLDGDAAGQVLAHIMQSDVDEAVDEFDQLPQLGDRVKRAFGEHWAWLSPRCRASLRTGELLNAELRRHDDDDIDFAPAVHVYSRALETELIDKIFEPFKASGVALPETSGDPDVDQSLALLRRYTERPGAKPPTLDVMARCLINVGHRFQDRPGNTFLLFLQDRLIDPDQFCRDFPKKLNSYIDRFRNRAAHIDYVSESDVREARAFLLEEPVPLLVWLAQALRPDLG